METAGTSNRIRDMNDLIEPIFDDKKVYISHTERIQSEEPLSITLAVEVKLVELDNEENDEEPEILKLLAKVPVFDEEVAEANLSFQNELNWYKTILPQLKQFQIERGSRNVLNCFLKFYGGRISLDPQRPLIDEDAVLLLEDPSVSGHNILYGYNDFDIDLAKPVLLYLAKFHAIPIAYKLTKPDDYQRLILDPFFYERSPKITHANIQLAVEFILQLLEDDEFTNTYKKLIEVIYENSLEHLLSRKNCPTIHSEPYGTIIHSDLSVFNILSTTRCLFDLKFVEFTYFEYSSPARDLLYFIFSSIEMDIIEEDFTSIIEYYFLNFIDELENLKCCRKLFTIKGFFVELKRESFNYIFVHCLLRLSDLMKDVEHKDQATKTLTKRLIKRKSQFLIRTFFEMNLV